VIDRMLDRIYDDFVGRVSTARDMTPEAVDAIGRGRVFTGVQAWENGLVDVVGGFDEALVEAKKLADIASFRGFCPGGSSWRRNGRVTKPPSANASRCSSNGSRRAPSPPQVSSGCRR